MTLKKKPESLRLFRADTGTSLELQLAQQGIIAGFPSPAADYMELTLDLNKELVKNPTATFYGRVKGNSMIDAGISEGDVLVIDKSLEAANGKMALCFVDGEFTVKWLNIKKDEVYLMPANKDFEPIKVTQESNFIVWGIVTYIIKKV